MTSLLIITILMHGQLAAEFRIPAKDEAECMAMLEQLDAESPLLNMQEVTFECVNQPRRVS